MAPSSLWPKNCGELERHRHGDFNTYIPQRATMIVALRKDCTNGAMIIEPAKIQ